MGRRTSESKKNAISIKTKNWGGVNSTNGIKLHPRNVDPHAFGVGDGVRPFLQLFCMRHCLYRLILTGILLELPSLWLETCQTLERCCFLLGLQCPASSVHHHNIHWCTGWHNNFNELYFWLFMSWERLEQLTWFLLKIICNGFVLFKVNSSSFAFQTHLPIVQHPTFTGTSRKWTNV